MAATSRRAARRTALFLLYQWDLTGQPLASLYEGDAKARWDAILQELDATAKQK